MLFKNNSLVFLWFMVFKTISILLITYAKGRNGFLKIIDTKGLHDRVITCIKELKAKQET